MTWAALLVLVTFASWRTYVLTARDMILDGPRDRFARVGSKRRDFLECPYCAGFWWSGVWVLGLALVTGTPDTVSGVALTIASWWAVAAAVVIIEHLVDMVVAKS